MKEFKHNFVLLHYYATPNVQDKVKWGKDQYNQMFGIFHEHPYVIADRSHIGELVYPNLYGGYDGNYVLSLEKKYNTKDIALIVFTDTAENLIERDDGLSISTDIVQKRQEVALFEKAYNDSNIQKKILININNLDEDQVFAKICHFLKEK